jgi:hypothetical protein
VDRHSGTVSWFRAGTQVQRFSAVFGAGFFAGTFFPGLPAFDAVAFTGFAGTAFTSFCAGFFVVFFNGAFAFGFAEVFTPAFFVIRAVTRL